MYGIGVFAKLLNIVPFAYFIIRPFAFGRGNMPGNRQGSFYRTYYRQYWQQVFFGRHLYVTVPVSILIGFLIYRLNKNNEQNLIYRVNMVLNSLGIEYDEEENKHAKKAFLEYKIEEIENNSANKLIKERALKNYNLLGSAIDDYMSN